MCGENIYYMVGLRRILFGISKGNTRGVVTGGSGYIYTSLPPPSSEKG